MMTLYYLVLILIIFIRSYSQFEMIPCLLVYLVDPHNFRVLLKIS